MKFLHSCSLVFAVTFIASFLVNTSLQAKTFHVNTIIESVSLCEADENPCSLRAAITTANQNPGLDTIVVPQGYYKLSLLGAHEDENRVGDLDILDDLVIEGAGPDLTIIDANFNDRAFDVHGVNFTLKAVTVKNGLLSEGESGAAIYAYKKSEDDLNVLDNPKIVIENSIFSKNVVNSLGGRQQDQDQKNFGGAIHVANYDYLSIIDSSIQDNNAPFAGGVYSSSRKVDFINTVIEKNLALYSAGAVLVEGDEEVLSQEGCEELNVINSSISYNESADLDYRIGVGLEIRFVTNVLLLDSHFDYNVLKNGDLNEKDTASVYVLGHKINLIDDEMLGEATLTIKKSSFNHNEQLAGLTAYEVSKIKVLLSDFQENDKYGLISGNSNDLDLPPSSQTIKIEESIFAKNKRAGATIFSNSETVLLKSKFVENQYEGATIVNSINVYIDQSEFAKNENHGLYTQSDYGLFISKSAFLENQNYGLSIFGYSVNVENSTVSQNEGNGLVVNSGGEYELLGQQATISLNHLTVVQNSYAGVKTYSPTSISNSILMDNLYDCGISDYISSDGYNIVGENRCFCEKPICSSWELGGDKLFYCNEYYCLKSAAKESDMVGLKDVHLGPLADNGGFTRTHALLSNSPAIDAGKAAGLIFISKDQRNYPRPVGSHYDIGAYEYQCNGVLGQDSEFCHEEDIGSATGGDEDVNASGCSCDMSDSKNHSFSITWIFLSVSALGMFLYLRKKYLNK